MSLREAAEKVVPKNPGPSCGFGKVYGELSDDDRGWIEEQRAAGKTYVYIAEVLTQDGHKVSDFTLARHLKGRCNCDPS